jgi:hypothetical protein
MWVQGNLLNMVMWHTRARPTSRSRHVYKVGSARPLFYKKSMGILPYTLHLLCTCAAHPFNNFHCRATLSSRVAWMCPFLTWILLLDFFFFQIKGVQDMLTLLDGSMWEGAPLYTCSHQDTSNRHQVTVFSIYSSPLSIGTAQDSHPPNGVLRRVLGSCFFPTSQGTSRVPACNVEGLLPR